MGEQETIQEFEALFAADSPAEETPPAADIPDDEPPAPDVPETPPAEDTPPADDTTPAEDTPPAPDTNKPDSKTNYAMAKLRTERNEYETLIRSLGSQLKLDPKLSVKEIADKIAEINTQRTADKYNLPVELAERLNQTDSILRDNAVNQRYFSVNAQLDAMRQKYGYDQAVEDQFINDLVAEGKHPLNTEMPELDMEAEYVKRNIDNIVAQQRAAAAAEERARLAKADQAPAGLPGQSPGAPAGDEKIDTVEGLDAYFERMTKANS